VNASPKLPRPFVLREAIRQNGCPAYLSLSPRSGLGRVLLSGFPVLQCLWRGGCGDDRSRIAPVGSAPNLNSLPTILNNAGSTESLVRGSFNNPMDLCRNRTRAIEGAGKKAVCAQIFGTMLLEALPVWKKCRTGWHDPDGGSAFALWHLHLQLMRRSTWKKTVFRMMIFRAAAGSKASARNPGAI